MKNPRIVKAYDTITPSDQQKKQMLRAILQEANFPEEPVRPPKQKERQKTVTYTAKPTKTSKKSTITAIAASIALLAISAGVLLHLMRPAEGPAYVDPTETTEPVATEATIAQAGVYTEVLERYKRAYDQGWPASMCLENGMSECTPVEQEGEGLYYAIADLDGNGIEELVISEYPYREGFDTNFIDLYIWEDGKVMNLDSAGPLEPRSLCEGGVLKTVGAERGDYQNFVSFWRLNNGMFEVEKTVYQLDGNWFAGKTEVNGSPISRDEADAIIKSYAPAKLDFQPIGEVKQETSLTGYQGFDDILAKYVKALTQGWSYQQCEQADISPQILTALPKLGWCLMDLDGNGVKELVISDTVHLYDLFVMMPHDGGPGHLVCGNGDTWYALCENGVIEKNVFYSSAKNWHYYTLKDTDLMEEYVIRYEGDMKNQYYYGASLDTLQPISEDEAGNRIATQRTAELNLTPFITQPSNAIDEMEYYDPLIARYRQALTEKWNPGKCMEEDLSIMVGYVGDFVGELGYALRDLNDDGINELIVTDGEKIYDLYTIIQDEITGPLHLRTAGERTNYYLTQENWIYCHASGSAFVSYYTLCRLDGMEWIQLEGYLYDARTDPNNPWYFFDGEEGESHDFPCGDLNVQGIIDSYEIAQINFTPFM
ncbi:MAG: hypothetical protein ACI3V0_02295 [Faecousia sp.]